MRTQDDILKCCREDINSKHFSQQAPLWLEYRKIEVLIDIRDILQYCLLRIADLHSAFKEKE